MGKRGICQTLLSKNEENAIKALALLTILGTFKEQRNMFKDTIESCGDYCRMSDLVSSTSDLLGKERQGEENGIKGDLKEI